MEKPENREKYLKNFEEFSKKVKLTEELKKKLREHKLVYFREQMEIVEVCQIF
jgi:ABC-type Zn uptake system ZnuABC Zn-binding protein ZnuA